MAGAYETIATFETVVQAHVAKSKLESEGIQSFIRDEHIMGVNPLYSPAMGGVRLQVEAADSARAKLVLETIVSVEELQELEKEALDSALDSLGDESKRAYSGRPPCVYCGSALTHRQKDVPGGIGMLFAFLGLGVYFPIKAKWRCDDCERCFRARR
jgi:hypothetical protein